MVVLLFMFAYVHRYSRKTNIWDKLLRSTKTEDSACDRIDDLCDKLLTTFKEYHDTISITEGDR